MTAIRVCPEATILSRSVAEAQYPHARVAAQFGAGGGSMLIDGLAMQIWAFGAASGIGEHSAQGGERGDVG